MAAPILRSDSTWSGSVDGSDRAFPHDPLTADDGAVQRRCATDDRVWWLWLASRCYLRALARNRHEAERHGVARGEKRRRLRRRRRRLRRRLRWLLTLADAAAYAAAYAADAAADAGCSTPPTPPPPPPTPPPPPPPTPLPPPPRCALARVLAPIRIAGTTTSRSADGVAVIYAFCPLLRRPVAGGDDRTRRMVADAPPSAGASQVECPRCQGKPRLYGTLELPRVAHATEAS